MRQEHVTLKNVEISKLFELIKKHLQEIKLDIIHEEKHQDYWDLKAHKGGKGRIVVGNIRDVEVMINGTTVTGHDSSSANWCMGERHNRPYSYSDRSDCRNSYSSSSSRRNLEGYMHLRNISGILLKRRHLKLEKERAEMSSPVTITP